MGINEENAKEIRMFVVDECCKIQWIGNSLWLVLREAGGSRKKRKKKRVGNYVDEIRKEMFKQLIVETDIIFLKLLVLSPRYSS